MLLLPVKLDNQRAMELRKEKNANTNAINPKWKKIT